MKPLAALKADLPNGARSMGMSDRIGKLKAGFYADIIAVPASPVDDITAVKSVSFVMKGGVIVKGGQGVK